MANAKEIKYMPKDRPGEWETGTLETKPERHYDLGGLVSYSTADVRDDDGILQKDVTVIPPDKK